MMRILRGTAAVVGAALLALSTPEIFADTPPPTIPEAKVLKTPADWRLERIPMPPGFARDIRLRGQEEIRFAPGMFNPQSPNYFTCIISIVADDEPVIDAPALKEFLEQYYQGLSVAVGRRKQLKPDLAQMKATVKDGPPAPVATTTYQADMIFFDSFSDGRKITLHIEATVNPLHATKQTGLLLLVSPSAPGSEPWKALETHGAEALKNMSDLKNGP